MGLTCECPDNLERWFYTDVCESTLKTTIRKRCASCSNLIELNSPVVKFHCLRFPTSYVEMRIHGDDGEIKLAPKYMCETCGDLYFSLNELGFCISLGDNMNDLVKEYAKVYSK